MFSLASSREQDVWRSSELYTVIGECNHAAGPRRVSIRPTIPVSPLLSQPQTLLIVLTIPACDAGAKSLCKERSIASPNGKPDSRHAIDIAQCRS